MIYKTSQSKNVIPIIIVIICVLAVIYYFKKDVIINFIKNDGNKEVEILGSKQDLVSFSIKPGSKVSGITNVFGSVQGGYFFEANILINILDSDKNLLKSGNANATSDWMTSGPVTFDGTLDFSGLPKGPAYIEIHNDNASGLPENDKNILIPITIE